LERLAHSGHRIVAVLTQPDRPAGRGRRIQASPVKQRALSLGLEVLQPQSLKRDEAARAQLRALTPDLVVVVAYGLILPREVLDIPKRGCVNIHASLLPRWRGAAPIQAAVLAGDREAGVSIMRLEEGLDTGPVTAMRAVPVGTSATAGELHDVLAGLGAELLAQTLEAILDGSAVFTPQAASGVTYAPKLSKGEAVLDWTQPAVVLDRRIRAYNPWPVAETRLDGEQLRCWLARPLPGTGAARRPGSIVATGSEGIDIQSGEGVLRLLSVQLAGGRRQDAAAFAQGHDLTGKVFGA